MNNQYCYHRQNIFFGAIWVLTMILIWPAISLADDTEIYLGDNVGSSAQHNVLFILDTSNSMKNPVTVNNAVVGTRISILKQVMDNLISSLDNMKVGYVRMNGTFKARLTQPAACDDVNEPGGPNDSAYAPYYNQAFAEAGAVPYGNNRSQGPVVNHSCYIPVGGTVLFPVTNLDDQVANLANNISVQISDNKDDAEQRQTLGATTVLDSSELNIGRMECSDTTINARVVSVNAVGIQRASGTVSNAANLQFASRLGYIRFTNIRIPSGATIQSARIQFTNSSVSDVNRVLDNQLFAISNVTGAALRASNGISDQGSSILTSVINAGVLWGETLDLEDDEIFVSPNLATVVQGVIDGNRWQGGTNASGQLQSNNLNFIIGANGAAGSGDQIFITTQNTQLDILYCDSPTPQPYHVGLRFQEVAVPQGAEILSAQIEFIAAQPGFNIGSGVLESVTILGHDHDDSPSFDPTNHIALRASNAATAARVDWTADEMGTWEFENSYQTPDLKTIVEEISERSGWCGGNDMTFILSGSSDAVLRRALSFDDAPANAAVLRVTYRPAYDASETGCNIRRSILPIVQNNHEAHQFLNNALTTLAPATLPIGRISRGSPDRTIVGLIFELPVTAGATVDSAVLQFRTTVSTSNVLGGPSLSVQITAEDNKDAAVFLVTGSNLSASSRPRVAGSGIPVQWSVPDVGDEQRMEVDITPLVSLITARGDWEIGNKLALFLENSPTSEQGSRTVYSFTAKPTEAPRLLLEHRETKDTASSITVRDTLLQINNSLTTAGLLGWTPSVETFFEAALYWRGKGVLFGKQRGTARIDDDGVIENLIYDTDFNGLDPVTFRDIDFKQHQERTLTSHPSSWTGGTYVSDPRASADVSCQFSNDPNCSQDFIDGDPTYISPIRAGEECVGNFQIYLTDGRATWVNDATVDLITAEFDGFSTCSVAPAMNRAGVKGRCAVEMLTHLATQDQRPDLPGLQTVKTYTIAFNLGNANARDWLEQLAAAGNGRFYEAKDANQLADAFDEIVNTVIQRPSSFAAPAISANAFNRLFSRDEIYFGLFEANDTVAWDGNLKKYNICIDSDTDDDGTEDCSLGEILDSRNIPATSDEGLFISSSISAWGSAGRAADGQEIRSGGAGAQTVTNGRHIVTDLNSAGQTTINYLNQDGHRLDIATIQAIANSGFSITSSDIRHIAIAVCPDPSATTDCFSRLVWMLGRDVRDEDGDNNFIEDRWWFADVLHSSPRAVTYGIDPMSPTDPDDDVFIDKVLVGTNEGGVHMINGYSGVEEWVFIPNELFSNQRQLYEDTDAGHIYGMDLSPVLQVIDNNGDGIIDPGESDKIFAYLGMRRGGNSYYALNITPDNKLTSVSNAFYPKLLWAIRGGTSTSQGNFTRLAQTWSEPFVGDIRCLASASICGSDGVISVLIFGGGYDPYLDTNFGLQGGAPNNGNAIYIVEAETGELLTWFSHAGRAATATTPAILDSGADIEVSDMLYSIMSAPSILDSDSDGFVDRLYIGDAAGQVWRIDLGDDIAGQGESQPAGSTVIGKLANLSQAGTPSAQRRFHYKPAVVQVIDTEYSDAAHGEFDYVVIGSGDRANPLDKIVDDRLYALRDRHIQRLESATGAPGIAKDYPLGTPSNAPIVETNLVDITNAALQSSDGTAQVAHGWYFRFSGDGQKVLSSPIVISGNVLATSYLPASEDNNIESVCGVAEGTGVAHNFSLLNAAASLDWDGDGDITAADRSQNLFGGIPSAVIPIFTKEGVTLSVGTGGGFENLGKSGTLPRYRTYWTEDTISF